MKKKDTLDKLIDTWKCRYKLNELKWEVDILENLHAYSYPGNISELYGILKQTVHHHQGIHSASWEKKIVRASSLPKLDTSFLTHPHTAEEGYNMEYELALIHLRYIEKSLKKYLGIRSYKRFAAEELGMGSADNMKKTYIDKYWAKFPHLVHLFPTIVEKYKLK